MALYVSPKEIEEARQMDALTYLQLYEPHELVPLTSGVFTTKTHDSLKINRNGKWYWWSRRTGGHTALDYLMAVKELSLPQAVNTLTGKGSYRPPRDIIVRTSAPVKPNTKPSGEFTLPKAHTDNKRVFAYLISRGIDGEIINHCFKHNLLYEDAEHHNAVFVGHDVDDTARYATKRGTASNSTFVGDVDLSDKRYCFSLRTQEPTDVVYLFECAIDALSFATLLKMNGKEWRKYPLLSLGGVYKQRDNAENSILPRALNQYLQDNPATSRIILCLDNDDIGIGAAQLMRNLITDRGVKSYPPPQGKDYNDYLHIVKGIDRKAKMRESERSDCR